MNSSQLKDKRINIRNTTEEFTNATRHDYYPVTCETTPQCNYIFSSIQIHRTTQNAVSFTKILSHKAEHRYDDEAMLAYHDSSFYTPLHFLSSPVHFLNISQ